MPENVPVRLKQILAAEEEVIWTYLFGSRAKGRARPESDWDVAVRFSPMEVSSRLLLRLDLQARLAEVAGAAVDVVDLDEAGLLLCHEVLRRRIVLVDKDPVARAVWEIKTIGEYLDWLPYHRRYARRLLEDLTDEGGKDHGRERDRRSPWDIASIHQRTPGRRERNL